MSLFRNAFCIVLVITSKVEVDAAGGFFWGGNSNNNKKPDTSPSFFGGSSSDKKNSDSDSDGYSYKDKRNSRSRPSNSVDDSHLYISEVQLPRIALLKADARAIK